VNPAVEDRLRAHVASILAGASVPARARSDLEEELFGHLWERVRVLVEDGQTEAEAGEQAILDFGAASLLSAELGRTYHSRLWASTIGVLLPAIAPASSRPAVVGWLRFILGLVTVLTVIALPSVVTMTPLRAVGSSLAVGAGLAGLLLAFRALARGQSWALIYAIGISLLLLFEGIAQVLVPKQPGSITIPLGAILAAGVLLAVRNRWHELQEFVASSTHVGRGFVVALAISLLAPSIAPRTLAALPDPSQATAEDLELVLSMSCDRGDVALIDGRTRVDVQRATLVVDVTWAHTDLLANGLLSIVTRPDDADTAAIRVVQPATWSWDWASGPTIIETRTGAGVGVWGSTSPSVQLLPERSVAGSFTVAIRQEEIVPNRTIRTTWLLVPAADGDATWPRIEAMYAHLDRFVVAGTVGCGEVVRGRRVPLPMDDLPAASPQFPF
jgi:hypothetical protein